MPRATEVASFLGGFTAGEGTFTRTADRPRFMLAVRLGAVDSALCDVFRSFLGVGTVHRHERRKAHYDDEVVFQVRRTSDLVHVVVPFMDEHLPPSYKRTQYEAWRRALLAYWDERARRRRTCTVAGCDAPQRAHGLCRRHLYERRGV